MGFEQSHSVWMNGSIIPWRDATLHVSAHALHYGTGVFEGIRCYDTPRGPAVFRLREHLERFFESARCYDMSIPYGIECLEDAICELVRRNGFQDCYIRPICYRGSHTLHLNPRTCPVEISILAWPWERYLDANKDQPGVRICISPWRKFHPQMMPTTAKTCGQYVNSVLATQAAERLGYDEALLLDSEGAIAEGAGENLFVVQKQRVLTNDFRHSILLGITRDTVLTIARNEGYAVETCNLVLEDLLSADEAFFTGTAAEVVAIREVEGTRIGTSVPGPVTNRIQKIFRDVTLGREPKYSHWLRLVGGDTR